ncbi:MAG: DUF1289 domain-containing protein [Methylococcaceae bacterium]|nr:DUF1289 domain-containing protein [Methylococcaceae bacterium]
MAAPITTPTPCIRQCTLDSHDVCIGCFRTLQEITCWSSADEQTRQQIVQNTKRRKQARQTA